MGLTVGPSVCLAAFRHGSRPTGTRGFGGRAKRRAPETLSQPKLTHHNLSWQGREWNVWLPWGWSEMMDHGHLPVLPLLLSEVPRPLRVWLKQEGIAYRDHRSADAVGRFVLFDSQATPHPPLEAEQVAIDVDQLRTTLGSDPFDEWLETNVTRGLWMFGPLSVSEEIAEVDRRAVRQRALLVLRGIIEAV